MYAVYCIYIYAYMITHVSSCIHLCVHVSIILYIYGDTCIHVRAVWLLLVSLRRFVNRKWSQGRISAAHVLLRPGQAKAGKSWENHGEPWVNHGLTHGFWWKKTMGKRFLCVSIVQHFNKVELGLEVTGSNHWVNTHPLIEHANLIQFIPYTSDHWTWLQRLTWWKPHPPGTSGCGDVPSMGNLGEKMGIWWEYLGEMHTSGQKNLSPMISMKKSSPHRTVPKGVPRACYIRGVFCNFWEGTWIHRFIDIHWILSH